MLLVLMDMLTHFLLAFKADMEAAVESAFPTSAPLISTHEEATLIDDERRSLQEMVSLSRNANAHNKHSKFKITSRPALLPFGRGPNQGGEGAGEIVGKKKRRRKREKRRKEQEDRYLLYYFSRSLLTICTLRSNRSPSPCRRNFLKLPFDSDQLQPTSRAGEKRKEKSIDASRAARSVKRSRTELLAASSSSAAVTPMSTPASTPVTTPGATPGPATPFSQMDVDVKSVAEMDVDDEGNSDVEMGTPLPESGLGKGKEKTEKKRRLWGSSAGADRKKKERSQR
jgi:hypothetical protein